LEVRPAPEVASELRHLDSGEQEVISLALAIGAESVLLDERKGRHAARAHGLAVAGTLGIIQRAARDGLVELTDALRRLEATNVRISRRVLNRVKSEP